MMLSLLLTGALAGASSLLQRIRGPSPLIEDWLNLQLDANDHQALRQACERDHCRLGSYYSWYLEKKFMAGLLRQASLETIREALTASDQTDYSQLDCLLDGRSGHVIAIPHFGHYIPAAIGIVNHVSKHRDIAAFYADPKTHKGNGLFDDLRDKLFSGCGGRAEVLHANREGLTKALRFIKRGGILLMFPDVHTSLEDSFVIPFLGRSFNVMLGSAALARKANGSLIPALPVCTGSMRYRTCFGLALRMPTDSVRGLSRSISLQQDYATTSILFQWYEQLMVGRAIRWQYIREHFISQTPFKRLDPASFETMWEAFLSDPRFVPLSILRLPNDAPHD